MMSSSSSDSSNGSCYTQMFYLYFFYFFEDAGLSRQIGLVVDVLFYFFKMLVALVRPSSGGGS